MTRPPLVVPATITAKLVGTMAYTEPVLLTRIDPDPEKRRTHWYDDYVATGGYSRPPQGDRPAARGDHQDR